MKRIGPDDRGWRPFLNISLYTTSGPDCLYRTTSAVARMPCHDSPGRAFCPRLIACVGNQRDVESPQNMIELQIDQYILCVRLG